MVEGKKRSRTLRRVKVRTPGGKTVVHYLPRKPKRPHCANCGTAMHGMKAVIPRALKSLAKTKKRPERPYGGQLCSKCMRRLIIAKVRQ